MITQVSGLNAIGSAKDPRRKAQSIQFRHHSNIPYTQNYKYDKTYERQQKNALWTSAAIVIGALFATMGYFVLTNAAKVKK